MKETFLPLSKPTNKTIKTKRKKNMTVFRNPEIQLLSLFFTVKNRIVLGSHTHKRQSNKESK